MMALLGKGINTKLLYIKVRKNEINKKVYLNQTIQLVMRKYRFLIISTVVLFLMINTQYYWKGLISDLDWALTLLCLIAFLVLLICLLYQLFLMFKERFKNRPRVYTVLAIGALLVLIFTKPSGIIDFEKLEGREMFTAWQEGVDGCGVGLILKENEVFYMKSNCFGIEDKMRGAYAIQNDTIKLKFSTLKGFTKQYEYGVYKPANNITSEVLLYASKKDTMPYRLTIFKNELMK